MTWTVITEASLFAFFLFAYFYLGSISKGPWPTSGAPSLSLALPNTIILLASSATYYWAQSSIERGNQAGLRIGLFITFLLGLTFVVIQCIEYHNKSFSPTSDAYGSLFFTITGFHGAHVVVGLIMNIFVQVLAWRGHFTAERHVAVENAGLYWHFVDAVWIVVYTCLYLVPYFR
jgi:heme/copper-type cytochrome/quinol oxidase subunit 3